MPPHILLIVPSFKVLAVHGASPFYYNLLFIVNCKMAKSFF